MTTNVPLTALELMENQACEIIADEVSRRHHETQQGILNEYHQGAIDAAERIRARIADRRQNRILAQDPFTRCSYTGCPEDSLGAFCSGHAHFVPQLILVALGDAIARNDRKAYDEYLQRAQDAITEATVR